MIQLTEFEVIRFESALNRCAQDLHCIANLMNIKTILSQTYMHVFVCISLSVHMCTYMHVCMVARQQPPVSCSGRPSISFEIETLIGLELSN